MHMCLLIGQLTKAHCLYAHDFFWQFLTNIHCRKQYTEDGVFQAFSSDLAVQFLLQLSCLSLQLKYEYMADSIIMYYFCVICLSHYLWHTRMFLARLRQ